jgi:uncharacterized protein (TIGR03086 family)
VHFVRQPPNVEMVETYNEGLLTLARRLPGETLRALLEGNTRRLFGLPAVVPEAPATAGALFADALDTAERVIAAVGPGDLDRPTPCTAWRVRDLLGHLVATARQADKVGRGARGSAAGIVRLERRDRWSATFVAAARRARAAWADDAAPPADVRVPWGLVPGPVALSGFVLELVAHSHDLAVSVGRTDLLDARLGAAALRIAERLVPADLRADRGAFAAPRPAPSGADAFGRLAAFLGRAER